MGAVGTVCHGQWDLMPDREAKALLPHPWAPHSSGGVFTLLGLSPPLPPTLGPWRR